MSDSHTPELNSPEEEGSSRVQIFDSHPPVSRISYVHRLYWRSSNPGTPSTSCSQSLQSFSLVSPRLGIELGIKFMDDEINSGDR